MDAKSNVRINTISPIATPTTAGKGIKDIDNMMDFADKMSPLGNASALECADYCVTLFSDLTRKVTMQHSSTMVVFRTWAWVCAPWTNTARTLVLTKTRTERLFTDNLNGVLHRLAGVSMVTPSICDEKTLRIHTANAALAPNKGGVCLLFKQLCAGVLTFFVWRK